MLLSDFIRENSRAVQELYPEREAREIVLRLCEDILGVGRVEHILNPEKEIDRNLLPELELCVERIMKNEPLQYVLGYADFLGRSFKVDPSVLIPRPETEDLVRLAVEGMIPASRVLDLCTGSGCIAWSIALERPDVSVTAVDISSEALEVARSQFSGEGPVFLQADVLKPLPLERGFDILLANPPYVRESEKSTMRPNVLEYEPGMALFVSDSDPFVFYVAIAARASELLRPGGRGFVEINENLASGTRSVFEDAGMVECRIFKDFAGKSRILSFEKPASGQA